MHTETSAAGVSPMESMPSAKLQPAAGALKGRAGRRSAASLGMRGCQGPLRGSSLSSSRSILQSG